MTRHAIGVLYALAAVSLLSPVACFKLPAGDPSLQTIAPDASATDDVSGTTADVTADTQTQVGRYRIRIESEPASGDARLEWVLGGLSDDRFTLHVVGTKIDNLLGIAFQATFDPALLSIAEPRCISQLSGGSSATTLCSETPRGRVLVGSALLRDGREVPLFARSFTSRDTVIGLIFRVERPGTSVLRLVPGSQRLVRTDGTSIDAKLPDLRIIVEEPGAP
ncbi:MAG: hypothetical protein KC609_24640 [Myxococcales bacterium]|nr:hypothetical protein [Myxococcales bacterium]